METRMQRIAGAAAIAGVGLLGLRRFAPGMRERCQAACARRMKQGGCGCHAVGVAERSAT